MATGFTGKRGLTLIEPDSASGRRKIARLTPNGARGHRRLHGTAPFHRRPLAGLAGLAAAAADRWQDRVRAICLSATVGAVISQVICRDPCPAVRVLPGDGRAADDRGDRAGGRVFVWL